MRAMLVMIVWLSVCAFPTQAQDCLFRLARLNPVSLQIELVGCTSPDDHSVIGFSPDGAWLVARDHCTVKVIDTQTLEVGQTLETCRQTHLTPDGLYYRTEQEIRWVAFADLQQRTILATRGHGSPRLWLSPDQQWIYFEGLALDGANLAFFRVNVESGELQTLHASTTESSFQLSPDGEWIAFTNAPIDEGVMIMNADGSDARQLVEGGSFRWSPDSAWVYFEVWEAGGADVFVNYGRIAPQGGDPEILLRYRRLSLSFHNLWTPQSDLLLDWSDGDFQLVSPVTHTLVTLAESAGLGFDGLVEGWLYFSDDQNNQVRYSLSDQTRETVQRLQDRGDTVWSRDRLWGAVAGAAYHLYLFSSDGTTEQNLTEAFSAMPDSSLWWSPDGEWLYFLTQAE